MQLEGGKLTYLYDVYMLQLGGLVILTLGGFFLSENFGDVFHSLASMSLVAKTPT